MIAHTISPWAENWPQHLSGPSIRKHQRIILSTDGLGLAMVNVLIRIAVISISYKDEPWIFYDKSISNTLWAGFKPQGVLNPFPCIKIVDKDVFFCKNSFLICWSWEFTRGNARGFRSALFWLLMPCFRGKETKCQGKCITFIHIKKKYLGHISS